MARATPHPRTPRRLADERGSMLVEVAIGGVLLVILAVGLFGVFDGSAQVSARTKQRAIAASLAQEDQERLRGMPITQISNLRQTLPVKTVAGVKYTVSSRADWIADAASDTSCTAGTSKADYLRIRSTVTTGGANPPKPVVLDSIVSPPIGTFGKTDGSLAVELLDRNEQPIADQSISISGEAAATDTTNAKGCAFFGNKPVGDYNVSFSRTNWVDWSGVEVVSVPAEISAGQTMTKSLRYDRAGSAAFTFNTVRGGSTVSVAHDDVRLVHTKVTRQFTNATAVTSYTATKLFPFADDYVAYAGRCDLNDPRTYIGQAGQVPVRVPPGGTVTVPPLRLPTANVLVRRASNSTAYAGLRVRLRSPCDGTSDAYTTNSSGIVVDGSGQPPALPYGDYGVCVDSSPVTGTGNSLRSTTTTLQNRFANGSAQLIINLAVSPSGSKGSVCT
jgi:hypothetical protein